MLQSAVAHSRQAALQEGISLVWGCTPPVRDEPRADTAHRLWCPVGTQRGKRNWLLNSIIPAWQKCPLAPRFAKEGGSASGHTQLLGKRSLPDPASVSWAYPPELASYLESFFLWIPLVCGFFPLCCFSKCPSSLAWP